MLKLDARGKRVLFISDSHIPYSKRGYLDFLKKTKDDFVRDGDLIIHVGDELDFHNLSFHDSDSSLFSGGHELDRSIEELHQENGLAKLFPKMFLLESNHGSMILRKTKHNEIPIRVLRPLPDLYETPHWSWHESILLLTDLGWVYCTHGKSAAYGRMVNSIGASVVQGHFHTKFEITYHRSVLATRFSMFVGCLADRDSLAMAYAKSNIPEFINGTGGIWESGHPVLFPMGDDWSSAPPPIPTECLTQQ
jgi:hypothetical protein